MAKNKTAEPVVRAGNTRLKPDEIEVLDNLEVEEKAQQWLVRIQEQLEPEHYGRIKTILVALGGRWHTGKKAHVFTFDPRAILAGAVKSGCRPENNPLDFFPTPVAVMKELLENTPMSWALGFGESLETVPDDFRVLEPSAGSGNIIRALLEVCPGYACRIDALEMNPINVESLRGLETYLGSIEQADFLKWRPDADKWPRLIVMNPPFSNKGNSTAYIDHIMHAWEIVRSNPEQRLGGVIAIAPLGWATTYLKKHVEFRNLVALEGVFVELLPDKAFRDSGTTVATCCIHLEFAPRFDPKERLKHLVHDLCITVENDQRMIGDVRKALKSGDAAGAMAELYRRFADEFFRRHTTVLPCMPAAIELFVNYFRSASSED